MGWNEEFAFFELPESMKHLACLFCDKNDPPCEWMIVDRTRVNTWAPCHQTCFHEWLEEDDESETTPEVKP